MFEAGDVAEWLSGWGIGAYFLSVLLNVVISTLGIVPSVFLTIANVLIFGWIPGFFVSWIGEMAGSIISYLLYRKGLLKLKEKYFSKQRMSWLYRLQRMSTIRQFLSVMIARIIPFVPSALVTVMSVISEVRISIYLLATGIGKTPSILLESMAGYGFTMIVDQRVKAVVTILLVISLLFVIKSAGNLKSKETDNI